MEVSGQRHALAALPLGKELPAPMDRKLGEPQSQFGCGGEEKNPCPCQELNLSCPACSLVAILTELSQLLQL
jgi:hypothetical protein